MLVSIARVVAMGFYIVGVFGSFRILFKTEDFIYISGALFGEEASEFFDETILLIVVMFFLLNIAIGLIIQLLAAVVNNTFLSNKLYYFNDDSLNAHSVTKHADTVPDEKKISNENERDESFKKNPDILTQIYYKIMMFFSNKK